MKISLVFITYLILDYCVICKGNSREKRYILVYPFGGAFKIVFGIGIPIQIGLKQSLSYAINFQFQYPIAQNITQLTVDYPVILSRNMKKREIWKSERNILYSGLENVLNFHGIDGNACLCMSICENARESFYHEDNGLYGHLLHILLTPDYGDDEIDEDLNISYIDAMNQGRYGLNCSDIYKECDHRLLETISFLEEY